MWNAAFFHEIVIIISLFIYQETTYVISSVNLRTNINVNSKCVGPFMNL